MSPDPKVSGKGRVGPRHDWNYHPTQNHHRHEESGPYDGRLAGSVNIAFAYGATNPTSY